ncbi:hypothetical protein ACIOBL_09930 [Paenibacillus taichungensis]|uniref:hypothetical protein n=1 Tax=Paenibacillus taichungensis TaxID=484184 RepID=UPI00382179B2
MQKPDDSSLIKFLGIEVGSTIHGLIDSSLDTLPYIGKIHGAYKMARLQKRVNQLETRISTLSITMYENDNKLLNQFIREKAFPIVLDELLSEHEEEKIDLVINGLEYTYKEELTEVSKILVYFDVLRELRVQELEKLITYSDHYKNHWMIPELKVSLPHPEDKEGMKKLNENISYKAYIDNHLSTLGLTFKKETTKWYSTETSGYEVVLTDFGEHFIDFFNLEVMAQIPAE